MPKSIIPAMRAHLDAETTPLAAIWRITRKDGARFFFTDHERDVVFGGEVVAGQPSVAAASGKGAAEKSGCVPSSSVTICSEYD
jgi:hypothetical protein